MLSSNTQWQGPITITWTTLMTDTYLSPPRFTGPTERGQAIISRAKILRDYWVKIRQSPGVSNNTLQSWISLHKKITFHPICSAKFYLNILSYTPLLSAILSLPALFQVLMPNQMERIMWEDECKIFLLPRF